MFCEKKKKNWINECTCALKENTPEGFIHGAGGGVEGHSKGARVPALVLWASRTLGSDVYCEPAGDWPFTLQDAVVGQLLRHLLAFL